MREARVSTTWNGDPTTFRYADLATARAEAMEVARFWYAEGHVVHVNRFARDIAVTVWDARRDRTGRNGSFILHINVIDWTAGDDDPMCFRCGRVPRVPNMMLCESCESEEPKGDK